MISLTSYEQRALASIPRCDQWYCVQDLGSCRLATLNRLAEKGVLQRALRPGPYSPARSVVFLMQGQGDRMSGARRAASV